MIRVYQFALRSPVENEVLVRAQLRAAHDYRNDLVRIERGRRWARRALDETDEVREAVELVKAATKSTRKATLVTLRQVRKAARDARPEELARIAELDASIRRDARALTTAYWGSYLTIEASAAQVRKMPLYDADGLTPSDPRFVRWTGAGQIGVQLQGGAATPDVLTGRDTRVRLMTVARHLEGRDGMVLWLRVGSDGRAPIWAKWPVVQHRAIPSSAVWKWARVSLRKEGPWERWSCEFTLEISGEHPRELDQDPQGAIAVEAVWDKPDDDLVVARWRDEAGRTGIVDLKTHPLIPGKRDLVEGLRKIDGIRSVRDQLVNDLRPRLARAILESKDAVPHWLRVAGEEIQAACHPKAKGWTSPSQFHSLVHRWRAEKCDAARPAYEMLDAWWLRDMHLWEYEAGQRSGSLRRRREFYRLLAVHWAREYRHVILDDRVLTREARFGEASDLRFTAAPAELRDCLAKAFGNQVTTHPVRDDAAKSETEDRDWCERAIDAWKVGGARNEKKKSKNSGVKGGAWADRKSKRAAKATENVSAREVVGNGAE